MNILALLQNKSFKFLKKIKEEKDLLKKLKKQKCRSVSPGEFTSWNVYVYIQGRRSPGWPRMENISNIEGWGLILIAYEKV